MEFSLEDSRKLKIKELRMQKNKVCLFACTRTFYLLFEFFFLIYFVK